VAVRHSRAVQRLSSATRQAESRPGRIGPINLDVKQMGERSAGNPHAAFDAAGAGNVARSRWCDTRRRKSEPTGNTNFDLNRRASPRPYLCGGRPVMGVPTAIVRCKHGLRRKSPASAACRAVSHGPLSPTPRSLGASGRTEAPGKTLGRPNAMGPWPG